MQRKKAPQDSPGMATPLHCQENTNASTQNTQLTVTNLYAENTENPPRYRRQPLPIHMRLDWRQRPDLSLCFSQQDPLALRQTLPVEKKQDLGLTTSASFMKHADFLVNVCSTSLLGEFADRRTE
jgi:hypothetical protein